VLRLQIVVVGSECTIGKVGVRICVSTICGLTVITGEQLRNGCR
jgi:hypothetical protein